MRGGRRLEPSLTYDVSEYGLLGRLDTPERQAVLEEVQLVPAELDDNLDRAGWRCMTTAPWSPVDSPIAARHPPGARI